MLNFISEKSLILYISRSFLNYFLTGFYIYYFMSIIEEIKEAIEASGGD